MFVRDVLINREGNGIDCSWAQYYHCWQVIWTRCYSKRFFLLQLVIGFGAWSGMLLASCSSTANTMPFAQL